MRPKIKRLHRVLALVLTIAALLAGQSAWAQEITVQLIGGDKWPYTGNQIKPQVNKVYHGEEIFTDYEVSYGENVDVGKGSVIVTIHDNGWEDTEVTKEFDIIPTSGTCGDPNVNGGKNVTWLYNIDTHTLTIFGTGDMADYHVYPAEWKDINFSSVIIGSGVTHIGNCAFYNCDALTEVTVYAPSCTLGANAFDECSGLSNIYVFGDKVSDYQGATNWSTYSSIISEMPVPNGDCGATGHESDVKYVLTGTSPNYTLTVMKVGETGVIGSRAWNDNYWKNIQKVVIEEGVTTIVRQAFYNYDAMTEVTIPSTMTTIGDEAFAYSNNLSTVNFNGGTTIGNNAFYECSNLVSITIPNSVTTIGDYAFEDCRKLETINIGSGVTSIGQGAFSDCYKLTTIAVDENNTAFKVIGGVLFSYDGKTLVVYPRLLTATEYTIHDGVTTICDYAFYECYNLTSVTIPASVTNIGNLAFYYCNSLATVTFAAGSQLATIGSQAFYGTAIASITIPASVTTIGNNAFSVCSKLESINVDDNNTNYASEGGVLFNKAKTTIIRYPQGKSGTAYAIPSSVTTIGNYAFYQSTSLASITIPASVTSIGKYAFSACNKLLSVFFADESQLESIGNYAFSMCFNLTSIIIPASVTSIGNYAFSNCFGLASVYVLRNSSTSPEITSLGSNVFDNCSSNLVIVVPDAAYNNYYMGWSSYRLKLKRGYTITDGVGDVITDDDEITVPTLDYIRDLSAPGATPDATVGGVDVDVYTLCLPYTPATGEGAKYYTLSGSTGSTLQFTEIDGDPVANTPYLVTVSVAFSVGTTTQLANVALKKEVTASVTAGDYIFKGTTIGLTNAEAVAAGAYILMAGNQWGQVQVATLEHPEYGDAYIPPFRSYIVSTSGARTLDNEFGNDDTTSIQSLQLVDRDGKEQWFDLSGRRIEKPTKKGIYIVNGKKMVFKR